ncbi:MAG TPA: Gfo/Idh/MocA family oxidoreductase [Stellaceae bacterium]|nr:Gfo/Idh/MocA family oxidoreductase [Stellaceae bacterium]
MRIAIFDAGHWHFPLYLDALSQPEVEVVGVSDSENFAGREIAARLGCPLIASNEALLAVEFDFALVLSRHSVMPGVARQLIKKGKPFLIEKPCGVASAQVARLRKQAARAGVFVAVPFIFRVSELAKRLADAELAPEGYQHLAFRFIGGPISRYERVGCSWMLDARFAGGGAAINLGVHFFDLIAALTGQPITQVRALTRQYRADVSVEEQAAFIVNTARGQIGLVETGYLYPSDAKDLRDFSFSLSHSSVYIQGQGEHIAIKGHRDLSKTLSQIDYNADRYYPVFLRRALDDFSAGRPPVAGLLEAEQALAVVEAGYASAAQGGDVRAIEARP